MSDTEQIKYSSKISNLAHAMESMSFQERCEAIHKFADEQHMIGFKNGKWSMSKQIHPVDGELRRKISNEIVNVALRLKIKQTPGNPKGPVRSGREIMFRHHQGLDEIMQLFDAQLQAAVCEAENNIAKRIDELAADLGIPSLTTWQQGKFIDSLKYEHMGEKWKYEQQEREETSIRPYGGTNNALFRVANSVSAAEVAEYLQAVADYLRQLKKGTV